MRSPVFPRSEGAYEHYVAKITTVATTASPRFGPACDSVALSHLQRRVFDWEENGRVLFLGLWRASLTVKAWRLVITAQGPGAIATRHVLLNSVAVVAAVLSARNRVLKLELCKLGLCAEQDRFFFIFVLLELVDTRCGIR